MRKFWCRDSLLYKIPRLHSRFPFFLIAVLAPILSSCAVLSQTYTAKDGTAYHSGGLAFGQAAIEKLKVSGSINKVGDEQVADFNQDASGMKAEWDKLMAVVGPLITSYLEWAAKNGTKAVVSGATSGVVK